MTMRNIKLEFDHGRMKKRVDVTKKQGSRKVRTMEMVDVKDPKCWEVITVEDSILYTPGQYLNKRQVESLCRGLKFNVEIGQCGQFKNNSSRY